MVISISVNCQTKVEVICEIPLTEIQILILALKRAKQKKLREDDTGVGRSQIVVSAKKIDVESVGDHNLRVVLPTDEFSESECSEDEVWQSRIRTS